MGCSAGRVQQNGNDQMIHKIRSKPFEILLLGDSGVGKTGLFSRCTGKLFSEVFLPSVRLDYGIKKVTQGDSSYRFKIWDTAGQKRFQGERENLFSRAEGIILVYSVANRASFDHIHDWVAEVKEHTPPNIKIILVGNKIDVHDQRVVLCDEGKQLANDLGFQFFETSAKQNERFDELFLGLVGERPFLNVKRAGD